MPNVFRLLRHSPPPIIPALLIAALLTGCAWKGGPAATPGNPGSTTTPADPNSETSGTGGGVWSPAPAKMRVYPSSKFATAQGQAIFEARIELVDVMGDSIKAVGRFRFELLAAGATGAMEQERLLYSWDIQLQTLAQQKQYYDPITRAYLFRLKLDNPLPARQTTLLRVHLTEQNGARLDAKESVKPGPPG